MRIRSIASTLVTAAVLAAAAAVPATASPAPTPTTKSGQEGTKSLASVLLADKSGFDRRSGDYDIVTAAVLAVLGAKPTSPVGLLTDGNVRLTAFLPNDASFRILVKDLTGSWVRSEQAVFNTVASLGIDTVETVLLYHVVPGATIDSKTALQSDGALLKTAQGGTVEVDVLSKRPPIVQLRDQDTNDADPFLNPFALDINKGNKQIAHGIFFVLRPADL